MSTVPFDPSQHPRSEDGRWSPKQSNPQTASLAPSQPAADLDLETAKARMSALYERSYRDQVDATLLEARIVAEEIQARYPNARYAEVTDLDGESEYGGILFADLADEFGNPLDCDPGFCGFRFDCYQRHYLDDAEVMTSEDDPAPFALDLEKARTLDVSDAMRDR